MHVLLTNDDGPPSDEASPYVHYLVEGIQKYTDWELSIAIPASQKSWIGKAHFVGHDVRASYVYTKQIGEAYDAPANEPIDPVPEGTTEWTLLDGTPASCANIGIHYLYKEKGPVDLVISGPNYGRNSTALYIMSSGTVGASMEAALCGVKSISVSYAYDTRVHNAAQITQAAKTSVKLIQHLYDNWKAPVEVYSINVPLCDTLSDTTEIMYTHILENKWGAAFQEEQSNGTKRPSKFMWRPNFAAVDKTVNESEPGNDGWVVSNGQISVTALKANFKGVDIKGSIKLSASEPNDKTTLPIAVVSTPNEYVNQLWNRVFKGKGLTVKASREGVPDSRPIVEYGEYDDLDFDRLMLDDGKYVASSYVYRKALIRKHYLTNTIRMFVAKNPSSILSRAYPESYMIEVDYAEFLDDALDEVYELRDELESGARTWILKPSMSDRGQGIRLFNSVEQLQDVFNEFDEGVDTDNEEDDADDNRGIITSQLRHFVVQEYLDNPLLLEDHGNRKFHIRTYVIAVGAIKVYVYREMLALFAKERYVAPIEGESGQIDLDGHLTNTCIQGEDRDEGSVAKFWDLHADGLEAVYEQVCNVTGDLFKAAVNGDRINFQSLPNAYEIYGLDFLVDAEHNVHLLEVNAYPDFKQTGNDADSQAVIEGLFSSTYNVGVAPLMGDRSRLPDDNVTEVLSLEVSGSW